MAVMGLRLAGRSNAVSKLHGAVSREMFGDLWPDVPGDEVPDRLHHQRRARRHVGVRRDRRRPVPPRAARVGRGRPRAVEPHPRRPRRRALAGTRRRAASGSSPSSAGGSASRSARRGFSPSDLAWCDEVLDPSALTICFARRFATYKRADAAAVPARAAEGAAARRRPAGAVRVRRQGPPGRRQRQGDDPADRRASPPTSGSATASCSSRTTTSPSPGRCTRGPTCG